MADNFTYKGVIYMYTFPNGKMYIGSTRKDPVICHCDHMDPEVGPRNSIFWAAYQEQGEPKYEIIEEWKNKDIDSLGEKLFQREEFLIRFYQTNNPQKGYNQLADHISKANENKLWGLKSFYTQEFVKTKQPLFDAVVKKLKHVDAMTKEELKVYHQCFGHNNIFGGMENGTHEDAEFWLGEEIEFAKVILEEDMRIEAEDYVHENAVPLLDALIDEHTVFQLDEDDNVLAKFASQNDAANALGKKNAANINNVLRGKQERAYGYKWVYAMKYIQEQDKNKL